MDALAGREPAGSIRAVPHPSEPSCVVLHALRCLGTVPARRIADAVGLPEREVESELIDLAVAGLVSYTPGVFSGWLLTEAGRTEVGRQAARELAEAGARAAVERCYDDFLVLNPELLQTCTAWQVRADRDSQLNDHSDDRYDAEVLRRLVALDAQGQRVCRGLATALARFAPYAGRLTAALQRALAGDTAAVTDRTDSYHAVWFQLHEDLLVTLDRARW